MLDVMTALFPYVVALYLLDCLAPVKRGQVLFSSLWGNRFGFKTPGLRFSGLFPMGKTYFAKGLSHGFTTRGFLHAKKDGDPDFSRESVFIPFEEITSVNVDGPTLKLNGKPAVELPSSLAARETAKLIGELKSAGLKNRTRILDKYDKETANLEKIRERNKLADRLLRFCGSAGLLLFIQVFVYVPVIIYTPLHLRARIGMVLLFIGLNYLAVVAGAFFTYRKMYEKARGPMVMTMLSFIFFPLGAIHAMSILTKTYFSTHDYLPLAAGLLRPDEVAPLIRTELRAVERGLASDDDDRREFWERRKKIVETMPDQIELTLERIFPKPPHLDPEAVTYCPYCLTDYRQGYDTCADCGARLKNL